MCIVDGPRWERMKKFNMNELYKIAGNKNSGKDKEATKVKDGETTQAKDADGKPESKESESNAGEGGGTGVEDK